MPYADVKLMLKVFLLKNHLIYYKAPNSSTFDRLTLVAFNSDITIVKVILEIFIFSTPYYMVHIVPFGSQSYPNGMVYKLWATTGKESFWFSIGDFRNKNLFNFS